MTEKLEKVRRARRIYFGVVGAVVLLGAVAWLVVFALGQLEERRKLAHRDRTALLDAARAVHADHEHGFRFELSTRFTPQPLSGADKTLALELLAPEEDGFRERVTVHVDPTARERGVYRVDTLARLFSQYKALVPHEEELKVGERDALLIEVEFPEARPPLHTLMLVVFGEKQTTDVQCTATEATFESSLPAFQAALRSFKLLE
jgi:hypothetical protein